ncbi:hypothetical protein GCM10011575_44800 [Microlunatus endophyticus]|uniref:Uncharacterized protein n=1 Tax=Microlunatus endophyticus TaxID=1716077 RepID=A0A917W7Z1_9ACTN|nr:hypothetical protein [Microlunatus endophyticus]GGL81528.1 hypothetical protein GCM10011575_44800 [Microlunatus endophyticus]
MPRTPSQSFVNNRVCIELTGKDKHFDRLIDSMARDAEAALGTLDGLGLYFANLYEDLDTSPESVVVEIGAIRVRRRPLHGTSDTSRE